MARRPLPGRAGRLGGDRDGRVPGRRAIAARLRDDARPGGRPLRHHAATRGAADRRPHDAAGPDADRPARRLDAGLGLADARRRRRRHGAGADARARARPLPASRSRASRCTSPSPTPTTGDCTVVLDATAAEAARLSLRLHAVRALARLRRRDDAGSRAASPRSRSARSSTATRNDRPLGARPAAAEQTEPHDEAGVLMETFNRFRDRVDETGRARARVRGQPRPRDPHAADDDSHRRRADRRSKAALAPARAAAPRADHRGGRRHHRDHRIDASPTSAGRADGDERRSTLREFLSTPSAARSPIGRRQRGLRIDGRRRRRRSADRRRSAGAARPSAQHRSQRDRARGAGDAADRRRCAGASSSPTTARASTAAALPHVFERYHQRPIASTTGAPPATRRGAASAWRSPGGCAICRAGGSRCARRSKAAAARRSSLSFDEAPTARRVNASPHASSTRHARSGHAAGALGSSPCAIPERRRDSPMVDTSSLRRDPPGAGPALLARIAWTCQHSRLDMALGERVRRFGQRPASPGATRRGSTSSATRRRAACRLAGRCASPSSPAWRHAVRAAATLGADPAHRRLRRCCSGRFVVACVKTLTTQHCPSDMQSFGGVVDYATDRAAPFWAGSAGRAPAIACRAAMPAAATRCSRSISPAGRRAAALALERPGDRHRRRPALQRRADDAGRSFRERDALVGGRRLDGLRARCSCPLLCRPATLRGDRCEALPRAAHPRPARRLAPRWPCCAWLAFSIGLRQLRRCPTRAATSASPGRCCAPATGSCPTENGLPFFHKPPLFYWLTAASMQLFGADAAAARLAPLLAGDPGGCPRPVPSTRRRWTGERVARWTLLVLATDAVLLRRRAVRQPRHAGRRVHRADRSSSLAAHALACATACPGAARCAPRAWAARRSACSPRA